MVSFNNGTLYIEGGKADVQAAREAIKQNQIFKAPIAKDTEFTGMNDFMKQLQKDIEKQQVH